MPNARRNCALTAAAALQRVNDEIAAAIAPLLPAGVSLDQFEAWLEKRDKALETEEHLQQSRRDLREAEADATDARQRLISALDAAGMPHDPDASIDAAACDGPGDVGQRDPGEGPAHRDGAVPAQREAA